jgi:hypothetical protein
MFSNTLKIAAACGLSMALLAGVGCKYDEGAARRDRSLTVSPYESVKLNVRPSRNEAVVGEVITFTADTENLLGRNATIQWSAPAGEIRTQEEGRVARVIFDEPGTYSVSAQLFIDDFEVRRDSHVVTVRPLR